MSLMNEHALNVSNRVRSNIIAIAMPDYPLMTDAA